LLIETGIHKTVDKVIVVSATKENRLQRLMDRGFSHDEAEKRIASQLPIREKVKHADFVIHNDGSIGDTQKQVQEIFKSLKNKSLT